MHLLGGIFFLSTDESRLLRSLNISLVSSSEVYDRYDRILQVPADAVVMQSLDYIFQLSYTGVLREQVVLPGRLSLYHPQQQQGSVSIVTSDTVEHWDPWDGRPQLVETIPLEEVDLPLRTECMHKSRPCMAPHSDYHAYGTVTPWGSSPFLGKKPKTMIGYWYYRLRELHAALDLGVDFTNWKSV